MAAPAPRQRPKLRAVRVEVLGVRGDEAFEAAVAAVQEHRAACAWLLRLFVTAFSSRAAAAPVLGDLTGDPERRVAFVFGGEVVPAVTGADAVRAFFQRRFLGLKLGLPDTVVVRQYRYETLRCAAYLVADTAAGQAVLVDPLYGAADALADAVDLRCAVTHVLVTRCAADVVTGWPAVRAAHPSAVLCRGAVGIELGPVTLRGLPTPGVSPDSVTFVLHHGASAVAAFTGDTVTLDGPGPLSKCGGPLVKAMAAELQQSIAAIFAATDDDTVVFPAHGGYSHTTHALDLAWAAHVADMRRAVPAFFDAVAGSVGAFRDLCVDRLRLPLPFTAAAVTAANVEAFDGDLSICSLLSVWAPNATAVPVWTAERFARFLSLGDHRGALLSVSTPLVIDTRRKEHFLRGRVADSVLLPLHRGRCDRHTPRGDLWLASVLVPLQLLVVIADPDDAGDGLGWSGVTQRFLTVGCPVLAFVAASDAARILDPAVCPELHQKGIVVTDLPQGPSQGAEGKHPALRSASDFGDVDAALGDSAGLVLDCRSPYEFRNGSQYRSHHVPLTDFRLRCFEAFAPAQLAELPPAAAAGMSVPPEEFAGWVRAGGPRRLVLYCAGGYRSMIGLSILGCAMAADSANAAREVVDVGGGAVCIMTRHAEHWLVKDRMVICVG